MHKGTILFFTLLFALAGHAQNYSAADSILSGGDTLSVAFRLADTSAGDTVYFGMDTSLAGRKAVEHFFLRHLRSPDPADSNSLGVARIYFIIDKTGRVTQAWYNSSDNINIGLAALGVVNQLPVMRPSSIKGEAVITKVTLKVAMQKEDQPYNGKLMPDITMTAGPVNR
ncbi:MAG: hypothetical protein Q8927_13760 [Bacteroidota bacterium]|nr:hypothetical protein [Bacteroidota bacterium]MDP4217264.1 hypothetical protein [Bacteroidota bacterium]MDP4244896.1 hypothetical protein [Bacteroidota bacterium]MDP4255483.1 hypothetical protein [Bacteroidota bacterium]